MDPLLIGVICIILLFLLMAGGLNIGSGMAIIGFAGFWVLVGGKAAFSRLAIIPFETVASFDLAVLPLFLLMANVIF
jgi:C4-dicarboxylate transporter DctM subunit